MLPKIFYGYFKVNACVHSYSTRSAEKLPMYSVSSSSGAKCIKFTGSQLWNNLPSTLAAIGYYNVFRSELRKYMLSELDL